MAESKYPRIWKGAIWFRPGADLPHRPSNANPHIINENLKRAEVTRLRTLTPEQRASAIANGNLID